MVANNEMCSMKLCLSEINYTQTLLHVKKRDYLWMYTVNLI